MACVNFAQDFTTHLTTLRIFEQCQIPPYTIDSISDDFSGTIMKFAITEPELHSDGCEVTHVCTDVYRIDGESSSIDCDDLAFNSISNSFRFSADSQDYQDGIYTPGAYEVVITHTAATGNTASSTFTLELLDPCDVSSVSLEAPDLADQVYTLGQGSTMLYEHPEFIVSPSFCPFTYEYNWNDAHAGDASSISVSTQRTFSFSNDDTSLDRSYSLPISVTATADSWSAGAQFTLSFAQAVDLTQVEIYEQEHCNSSGWMVGLSVGKFNWQLTDLQSVGGFTSS